MLIQVVKILAALAVMSPLVLLSAAESDVRLPPITLDEAIARALASNLDLAAVRQETDAALALRDQAALRPNPTASYDIEQIRGGNRASGITFSVPLELGGKRAARISAAERGQDVAEAEVGQRRVELRAATIEAYFELLAAQQRAELARASLDIANRALDAAARRVQAGRVSPVDETRARVVRSTARIEQSQADLDVLNARQRVYALWGVVRAEPFVAVTPEAQPHATASAASLAARIEQAPELVRLRAEAARRDALTELARTQAFPSFAMNVGTRTLVETGDRANAVGLSVAIPVFDRNQGNIRDAQIRSDQARQLTLAAEVRLRSEVGQALERLSAARTQSDIARHQLLPDAESALNAATRGFELGKFGFLDVLEAQRALFLGRGQLVRALADAYRASADIERLIGIDR